MLDADRDNPAALLASYRTRAGLTRSALVRLSGVTSQDASHITDYESGLRTIRKREHVLAYARALDLDPWETDHFLFVWGHAPVLDWQRVALALAITAGHGGDFHPMTLALYRETDRYRGEDLDDQPRATPPER
jgi:transcriptional regulator with XRE-family HTH domain